MLSRQGDRLLQLGVALFLVTSFEGFVIPGFAAPRLGLSAHSLMALLGVLFIAIGLLWPKLSLGTAASQLAFGCWSTQAWRSSLPICWAPSGGWQHHHH